MPQRIGVFREDNAKKIAHAARTVLGMPGTFAKIPERIPRWSAGSCACPEVHEITTTGSPSSGSATLTYSIGGTGDTITINYDDTAAEVQTAFETHSEVTSGDVVCTGGPLPSVAVYARFAANLVNTAIGLPTISDSITGGDLRLRKAASHDWTA